MRWSLCSSISMDFPSEYLRHWYYYCPLVIFINSQFLYSLLFNIKNYYQRNRTLSAAQWATLAPAMSSLMAELPPSVVCSWITLHYKYAD